MTTLPLGLAPFTTSTRILPQPHASPEQAVEEREWLLRRLRVRGPQSTTMDYARSFIFPDLPMYQWANAHDIQLEFYSLPMGMKQIDFVRFTRRNEPRTDWISDWYTKKHQ